MINSVDDSDMVQPEIATEEPIEEPEQTAPSKEELPDY